jgi:hypothetical protein
MIKKLTNTKFVTNLMDFSEHGTMMQLVVLEALHQYPTRVLKNREALTKSMEHSFISPEAWISTCEELLKRVEDHLDSPKKDAAKTG